MSDRGKQFEKNVQKQIKELGDTAIIRLYDVTMGYCGIDNPCDFVVYRKPKMILLECKTIKGHLLNFKSHIRENQWRKMLEFSKVDGVVAGILVWFYEQDLTYFLDIRDLEEYKSHKRKSFDCTKDKPTIALKGIKYTKYYKYFWDMFLKEICYE